MRSEKVEGNTNFAYTEGVYEIDGNIRYMRCVDFCDKAFFKTPTRDQLRETDIPTCNTCGEVMRPHLKLFDEPNDASIY